MDGDLAVGQGPAGSYHHEALLGVFGNAVRWVYHDGGSFAGVMEQVADGQTRFGTLAVHLSSKPDDPITAANRRMVDEALESGVITRHESKSVPVRLGLIGLAGTTPESIRTVIAQPVAETNARNGWSRSSGAIRLTKKTTDSSPPAGY